LYEDEGVDYDLGADGTKDPVSHQNFHLQLTNKDLTFSGSYMHVQATDFMFFGNLTGNGINRYNSTFWNANLDYNTNISETVNFTLQGAYSRFKQDGLGVGLPEGTPSPLDGQPINHAFIIGPYIISHDIQLSSRLNWQMHPKHNLFTGVDFRISGASDFDGYTNYLSADESLYFPANSLYINRIRLIKNFALFDDVEQFLSILGVFTQYKAMLAKNFTAFLGVRYDNYFKIAGTINPRIGLIYQTPFGATFKALYGSAFRAPVLSELYLNSPFDLANNQLKPEKISTFELIYLQKIKQTELSLTFFDNQSKNLIVTQGLPDGRSTSVNVTETRIGRGIEFASQVVLSAQFSAYLSYTYYLDTDGLEQNTFQQFAAAYFNFQGKKWAFNINGIFRPALTAALEDQKSYTLLNLKTKYQLNKKFGLSLVFLNLLDTKYQTPVRESSFGVPNRGIQWRVGLDFKFSR
jgi:outer membrane receptor protein involved in Fe transport